jgi:hypothetical protein
MSYGRICRRYTCRPYALASVGIRDRKHNTGIALFLSFSMRFLGQEVLRRSLGSVLGLVNGSFVAATRTVRLQPLTQRILSKVWFFPIGNQTQAALGKSRA